jgi:hypothetical protein
MPKSSELGDVGLIEISNLRSVRVEVAKISRMTWNLMVKVNLNSALPRLLDLANLQDDGVEYYARRHGRDSTPGDALSILELRDEVRQLWQSDESLAEVAQRWLSGESQDKVRLLFEPQSGALIPNPGNDRVLLLFTFLRFRSRLRCCENPGCQTYFIRTGRRQRFCDKPSCAACAQRFYKLRWWQENGSEWRAKRKKVRSPSS